MMASVASIASLNLTGIHSKRVEWIQTTSLCWFCLDELNKEHNKHHVLPKRYFRNKQQANEGNVVRVCIRCHDRFNDLHDHSRMSLEKYLVYLSEIDWGFGIFVEG